MKAKYEVPITEIIKFETEDIITTSNDLIDGGKNGTAETVEFNNLFPNA